MQEKQNNELRALIKIILPLIILICFIGIFYMVYRNFAPNAKSGEKEIHVTVIDDQKKETNYVFSTNADYLKDALDEIEPLSYSGVDSEYGLMVDTVNGLKADYNADGSYWAFYVNQEYCDYGIETQVVNDGDYFSIVYQK